MNSPIRCLKSLLLGLMTLAALSGCGSTGEVTGNAPVIQEQQRVISLPVSSSQYSNVRFTHEAHAAYQKGECLTCHSHTGIRDTTIWRCKSCHSPGDPEGLCLDDSTGHGCWMKQCEKCHLTLTSNPTPGCFDCHSKGTTGVFLDGPVENLFYSTASKKGFTDASGTFRYEAGETAITFSLGDIVLGTGTPKPIMTPIDLVPGAVDQNDQGVVNISRFLQTLDLDGIHGNGIQIPLIAYNHIKNRAINFYAPDDASFAADLNLQAFLADLNANLVFLTGPRNLIDPATARTNLLNVIRQFHTPPSAGSVAMTGGLYITGRLTGTYAYSDLDGDLESGSTYQWYRDADSNPGGETPIPGATSLAYSPVNDDQNHYLVFEVTPADKYHAGSAVRSAATGPVTFDPSNAAPSASGCAVAGPKDINGNLVVNSHFLYTASYTYNDVEGDPESGSTYQWYIDADMNPSNGNETLVSSGSLSFSPPASAAGSYLFFRVTPRASRGTSSGAACTTAAAGPITSVNSVTAYDSLGTESQVKKYSLRFSAAGGVVADLLSYEGWDIGGYSHHGSDCYSCHSDAAGPKDLGFRTSGSNNGNSNDILTTNLFLFRATDVSNSATYVLMGNKDGYDPGLDAPGVFGPKVGDSSVTRSSRNPYLDMSGTCADAQYANQQTCTKAYCDLAAYQTQQECEGAGWCSNGLYSAQSTCTAAGATWNSYGLVWHAGSTWTPAALLTAGDYVLSVGAMMLDENAARTGSNGGGDNYGWTDIGNRNSSPDRVPGNAPSPAYRNYKIQFTFN